MSVPFRHVRSRMLCRQGGDATFWHLRHVKIPQSPLSAWHVSAATCAGSRVASDGHVSQQWCTAYYNALLTLLARLQEEQPTYNSHVRARLSFSEARSGFRTLRQASSSPPTPLSTGELSRQYVPFVLLSLYAHPNHSATSFSNCSSSRSRSTPYPSGKK